MVANRMHYTKIVCIWQKTKMKKEKKKIFIGHVSWHVEKTAPAINPTLDHRCCCCCCTVFFSSLLRMQWKQYHFEILHNLLWWNEFKWKRFICVDAHKVNAVQRAAAPNEKSVFFLSPVNWNCFHKTWHSMQFYLKHFVHFSLNSVGWVRLSTG